MNKKITLLFFIIIAFVLMLSLFFVKIPSPSTIVSETYKLNIK
tara:strand:+ start:138 stop:266 length:129 start_codon:yes stop_codon:yes gene_type:complete